MNDASQETEKTPDVGTRIQFEDLQLVVMMRHSFEDDEASCAQCWGSKFKGIKCSSLPQCGVGGYADARLFVPDLEHEPTAQRIALMRLRGEL